MLTGRILQLLSQRPDGQTIPVAAGGEIVEDPLILVRLLVVPVAGDDGVSAERAERGDSHGDPAAGQGLGDHVPLGGHRFLALLLRGGAIQQDVHGETAGVRPLDPGKDLVVLQIHPPPHPSAVQRTGRGMDRNGLQIRHHGVPDACRQADDAGPVPDGVGIVGGSVPRHLFQGLLAPCAHISADAAVPGVLSPGVIQAAELVGAGAEFMLQLRYLPFLIQRRSEIVPDVFPKGRLRLGQRLVAQAPLKLRGVLPAARPCHRVFAIAMAEAADGGMPRGDFPEEPVQERRLLGRLPIALLPLTGREMAVLSQEIQRLLKKRGAVQITGEFQGIQHGPFPGHQMGIFPQHTAEMGLLQKKRKLLMGDRSTVGQDTPGIAPPQSGQRWTTGRLPLIDRVLQAKPYQLFVQVLLFAAPERRKQPVDGVRSVVPADRADDAVPVQVRPALLVIDLELRLKAVLPCGVPDQIPGPPLFTVQHVHQVNTSP